MDRVWLVQRSDFRNLPEKTGIDQIIGMDYMGSSEFENWGSNPHKASLDRIRENINEYYCVDVSIIGNKTLTVFCKKSDYSDVVNVIYELAKGEMRLKEYCDLSNWVKGEKDGSDHWWDIGNDFMFWKKSYDELNHKDDKYGEIELRNKFTERFMGLIQPPIKSSFLTRILESIKK